MPGIPPEPTPAQFDQIAEAIDPNAHVVFTRKLVGGIAPRMDVLKFAASRGVVRANHAATIERMLADG